ncbi:MAG TPA: family 20 glycosylhydrolase [Gemmatimonadales bacterium]|nr:family 20 glycosylhydrolase [Gemmatimonadales bacterium]
MRLATLILLLTGLLAPAQHRQAVPPTLNLMPVPRSVALREGGGRLIVDSTFAVAIVGTSTGRLERGVTRALARLAKRTGVSVKRFAGADSTSIRLVITARSPGQAIQTEMEDESYTLSISAERASLVAPTVVGVLHGLETLLQLVAMDGPVVYLPAVLIEDAPRFPWRGLLVDAGRHFEPVEVIERTLDGMAAVKLNVLHWHLSEDQGFRVQSLRYPRLQRLGSDGLFYTQAQIRAVVAYARDRGIRVIPEFDMPGHTTSWFVGYPQFASGRPPYQIVRTWGVYDATFDPSREEVYRFIDGFIGEMSALFPDPYWHIGGDEVNGKEWDANTGIRRFKRLHSFADNAALHAYFNQRLARILERHGKRMIGWDEILNPNLPASAVVQSWRGIEYLPQTVRSGHHAIMSAPYYLDQQYSAEDHYVDPVPDSLGLTPEEAALVMGGEACMWGEHIGPETIDSRLWPRLAAVAEKLWSSAAVTDVHDMYRRLRVVSTRLEELGLGHDAHSDRLLRRAVPDGPDFQALQALLAVSQPVTFGQRHQLQVGMNQQTPLTGLVDMARPDPPARWNYLTLIERFLADSGHTRALGDSLRQAFASWRALAPAIQAAATRVPLAEQGVRAANALARVGTVGLAAMDRLSGAIVPTRAWQDSARAELNATARSQGLLRLAVVDVARWLVEMERVKP